MPSFLYTYIFALMCRHVIINDKAVTTKFSRSIFRKSLYAHLPCAQIINIDIISIEYISARLQSSISDRKLNLVL